MACHRNERRAQIPTIEAASGRAIDAAVFENARIDEDFDMA